MYLFFILMDLSLTENVTSPSLVHLTIVRLYLWKNHTAAGVEDFVD